MVWFVDLLLYGLKKNPIVYPDDFDPSIDHSFFVDLMKCTNKKFKGQQFYFDHKFSPNKEGSTQLSKLLCNAACFSGYSMINNRYNRDLKEPDHDMSLSFKLHCQRYQVYNDRQKHPKQSTVANNISTPIYQNNICKQSAVNDRKNCRKNGCLLKRKANYYRSENKTVCRKFKLIVRCTKFTT